MRLINRASTGTALKAMQCIVTMTNGLKGRESADALGIQVVKCETRIVRGMLPIQTIRLRKPNRHRKGLGMDEWDMQSAALDGAMIGIAIGDVIMIAVIVYTLLY